MTPTLTLTTTRRALVVALAAVMLVLVAPVAAHAHRTTAVGPGESIQAAVDAAGPGDTVVVSGTHRENVAIQTDHLTLRGVGAVLRPPATPAAHACFDPTEVGEAVHGLCVIGDVDFDAGEVSRYVEGVTVSGFTIRGFAGSALVAVGARGATFTGNVAIGNDDGVRSTASIGTRVIANRATGGRFGVRVASSSGDRIVANTLRDNCVGAFVLSTPAGVAGDLRVVGNVVDDNTRACAADEDFPPLSGIGVGLLGTAGVTITGNHINDNLPGGETAASGGVVALASPDGTPLTDTVVRGNVIRGNDPDILWDETGTGNVFRSNVCDTSSPVALC